MSTSKAESRADDRSTILDCNLSIQILLENAYLRDGCKCACCSKMIGVHPYEKDIGHKGETKLSDGKKNVTVKEDLNTEYDRLTVDKKEISLSPADVADRSAAKLPTLSSGSDCSSSMKSSASSEAFVKIHTGPIVAPSETEKKNNAEEKKLRHRALVEASNVRQALCKNFLNKYYCLKTGTNVDELYVETLLAVKEDSKRLYYLMKHARHSCLNLMKLARSNDQLVNLFKFLDQYLPRERAE